MVRVIRLMLLASLFFFVPGLASAEWQADFLPPKNASDSLTVYLPENLDFLTLTTLGLEVDGVDVTGQVTSPDGDFVFTPDAPFSPGEHRVRLIVYQGDGDIVERQAWGFSIEGDTQQPGGDSAATSLIEPVDGVYDQSGPLVIAVAEELDSIDYGTLRVELDQIDMTDVMEREPGRLILSPPERLAKGLHSLAVVAFDKDGNFQGLGSWIFTATLPEPSEAIGGGEQGLETGDRGPPPVSVRSNNSLEAIARLLEENLSGSHDTLALSGAGQTNLSSDASGWRFQGGTNYFLETQREVSQTDEVFDIGEYEARLDYRAQDWGAGMAAGHQSMGYDSFIMSNFYRRGLSLRGDAGDGLIQAQGFALGAASQLGAEDPLALQDRSGEVIGGGVTLTPFELEGGNISFTGIYYEGEEGVGSFGQINNQQILGDGEGWSLGFASDWFDGRLRVDGEVAESDFDADGSGNLVASEDSEAYALRGAYDLIRSSEVAGDYMNLTLSGGWEQVGSLFASVANPGLAADRETVFGGADLTWGGLYTSLQLREDENNVDSLPGLPRDRVRSISLDGQYAFAIERKSPDDRAWLGSPYLLFGTLYAEADRIFTPAAYIGPGTDNSTFSIYGGFGSSYQTWGWQFLHQRSDYDDKVSTLTDYRNSLTDLSVQWFPSDRLSLSLGGQVTENENPDLDTSSYDFNTLLAVDAEIVPETLDLSLSYNMNLRTGSGDTPDRHLLNGELGWTLRPAERNSIGIELALRGSMEWNEGSSNEDDVYEAFTVLRLTAPLAN